MTAAEDAISEQPAGDRHRHFPKGALNKYRVVGDGIPIEKHAMLHRLKFEKTKRLIDDSWAERRLYRLLKDTIKQAGMFDNVVKQTLRIARNRSFRRSALRDEYRPREAIEGQVEIVRR
jgi:hypothetical protein